MTHIGDVIPMLDPDFCESDNPSMWNRRRVRAPIAVASVVWATLPLSCSEDASDDTHRTQADDGSSRPTSSSADLMDGGTGTGPGPDAQSSTPNQNSDDAPVEGETNEAQVPDGTSAPPDDEPQGGASDDAEGMEAQVAVDDAGVPSGDSSVGDADAAAPPAGVGYGGGERVKIRVGTTPDGTDFPLGLHDDSLGVDCVPRETAEGLICVPSVLTSPEVYVDSECETAGAVVSDECELPEYVAVQPSSPQLCNGLYEANAYRVSTRHDTGVRYNGDACYESAYDPERYSMYELEPMALEDLPALALEALPSSDTTAGETLIVRSDDGAFSSLSLAIDGHTCQLVEMDGSLRCIAGAPIISAGGYYSDAECSDDVATTWMANPDCDDASHALFYAPAADGTCEVDVQVREVLGLLDSTAPMYAGDPESCYETIQSDRGAYYVLGAPAAPSDLPEVTLRLAGEGRLKRIEYRFRYAPDSPPAYSPRAYDSAMNSECSFWRFSDGNVRCVPVDAVHLGTSSFFADPECSTKLASIQDCVAARQPLLGYVPVTALCELYNAPIAELYEFGELHTGEVHQLTDAGCQAVVRLDSVSYFVLALVDPDSVLIGINSRLE